MQLPRRQFLILAAGAVAGCRTGNDGAAEGSRSERIVNAGPTANYAAAGVYQGFRDQGFFVVRQGDQLFALSAFCTHRKCKLIAEPNRSFLCPCHGSTFDSGGRVTKGPASRDLPILPATPNNQNHLLVSVPAQ